MTHGFTIVAVDPDDDYLSIEIHAANTRFAGSTRIYAGLEELSEFATQLVGFPKDHQDRKTHEFGTRDPGIAGGYCSIDFFCLDHVGHVGVEITFEDDDGRYDPASAQFTFRTEAAAIDRFIESLRAVQSERSGSAVLSCTL